MGAALPVLLVVADLETQSCFFVCLNDYIDKVLVPRHGDYTQTAERTIHAPTRNVLASPSGLTALRWYAKRPKLFAAFQKFVYQEVELKYSSEPELAKHFATILLRYDIWDDTEMWPVIAEYGTALRRFLDTGSPDDTQLGGFKFSIDRLVRAASEGDEEAQSEIAEFVRRRTVDELWRQLALLPRIYEETCREWYLPTPVGFLSCDL
jgi:hypothetical protein